MGHFWTDKDAMAFRTWIIVEGVTRHVSLAKFPNAKSSAHKHAKEAGLEAFDKRWKYEEERDENQRLLSKYAERRYQDGEGNIRLAKVLMS